MRRRESDDRLLSRVVLPASLSFSRLVRRSLRWISLAVWRLVSSHRTEATELLDDRSERPENVEMPDAVEGGRKDGPLDRMDEGRPCALRMR